MIPLWGATGGLNASLSFQPNLTDAGAGIANITLLKGAGSATFTRATTAWTKLITGAWASVASGQARFCYIGRDTTVQTQGGYFSEVAATQLTTPTASIRDMTDASWVKTGVTPAKNASGISGSNLLLQSDDLSIATWVKVGCSITTNTGRDQYGNLTLDLMTEALDVAQSHSVTQNGTSYVLGQQFSMSGVYVPNGKTKFRVSTDSTPFAGVGQSINFDTVALTAVAQSGTSTGSIVLLNNGVYKWTVNLIPTTTAGASAFARLTFLNTAGSTVTYNGDGVSGAYIGQFQMDEGKAIGVYTPTTTVAVAASATALTATTPAATVLHTLVAAASSRQYSAFVRRKTGTGTITLNNGTATLDITALINSTTYTRVQLNGNDLNAAFGFTIATSGDEIEVDFNQFEAGSEATSPIDTAGATRNADSLTYPNTGNVDFTKGTLYAKTYTNWSMAGSSHDIVGISGNIRALFVNNSQLSTMINTFDGTTTVTKSGLTAPFTAMRKRICSWGGAGQNITGDGASIVNGAFDGSFGSAGIISIGNNTGSVNQYNGIIESINIYYQQFPNSTLQAMTS